MSSPVHHPEDLDAALMYAPPWARSGAPASATAAVAPVESPPMGPTVENEEPTFIGDRAMLRLRRRLSLDPEIVPEPPSTIHLGLTVEQIALRLSAVAAFAALVAWGMISLAAKPAGDKTVQAAVVPVVPNVNRVKLIHVRVASETASQQTRVEAGPALSAVLTAAKEPAPQTDRLPVLAPQPHPSPAVGDAVPLDRDEIAMLVKRGKDHLMNGDVSSARLLLRRAAEAGDAEAALALGSTFDPLVIERLGALGVQTDAAKARKWYEKAAQLGSQLAPDQLANLARAGQ